MAVISLSAATSYKEQVHRIEVTKQIERSMSVYNSRLETASRCFSPLIVDGSSHCIRLCKRHGLLLEAKKRRSVNPSCMVNTSFIPVQSSKEVPHFYSIYSHGIVSGDSYRRAKFCSAVYGLETGSCERQLRVLDSYFVKLQDGKNDLNSCLTMRKLESTVNLVESHMESSSQLEGKMRKMIGSIYWFITVGLALLGSRFSKLNAGNMEDTASPTSDEVSNRKQERTANSITCEYHDIEDIKAESNNHNLLESTDDGTGPKHFADENIRGLSTYDETSDFYIIGFLAAINIAVFLFEIASPIRNSDVEQLSLPLIYGGKINKLILVGEWWRLFTPMFLHSGFIHVALSIWVLLKFGPQVCRGYGSFTFFLIYALGGISGNLISFLHTPELTVCGTGPVFAIIGAWLVYRLQHKEIILKEASESMFWNAVIATALSFVLSNFGRIDNWTHLAATLSGIIFGYITCPRLNLDDTSSKQGQREGIAIVGRQTDMCKSLITFTISIIILGISAFFYQPQLEMLELDPLLRA